jgi:16S rRNA (guanine966-N2)-methyltransferase
MKLRIISGSLKGRIINGPDKDLSFRPTLERTRQSIADMITPLCRGAVTADICAGSGAFGFEMLSRGAKLVDFVENNRARAQLIRAHAEKFGVLSQCRVLTKDAAAFSRTCDERYAVIFFDPPYNDPASVSMVPAIKKLLQPGGVLLHQRRRPARGATDNRLQDERPHETRAFGDTIVEIFHASGD